MFPRSQSVLTGPTGDMPDEILDDGSEGPGSDLGNDTDPGSEGPGSGLGDVDDTDTGGTIEGPMSGVGDIDDGLGGAEGPGSDMGGMSAIHSLFNTISCFKF